MAIKSKEHNKFYIKQLVINDKSFQEIANELKEVQIEDKIIGYIFSVREDQAFIRNKPIQILNVYLIKRDTYQGDELTLTQMQDAWELFLLKCDTEKKYSKKMVFKNPPIDLWFDTKENWCKKLASLIVNKFGWTFEEAVSQVNYAIMLVYGKSTVYMGNLNYLKTSVFNSILMQLRYNKKRLNQDGAAISLNTVICDKVNDETITLEDTIEGEFNINENLEYEFTLKKGKELLSQSFSEREIDQILNKDAKYLPLNVYRRLLSWRQKHKESEIYEER